jgi:hypothetical protein
MTTEAIIGLVSGLLGGVFTGGVNFGRRGSDLRYVVQAVTRVETKLGQIEKRQGQHAIALALINQRLKWPNGKPSTGPATSTSGSSASSSSAPPS